MVLGCTAGSCSCSWIADAVEIAQHQRIEVHPADLVNRKSAEVLAHRIVVAALEVVLAERHMKPEDPTDVEALRTEAAVV